MKGIVAVSVKPLWFISARVCFTHQFRFEMNNKESFQLPAACKDAVPYFEESDTLREYAQFRNDLIAAYYLRWKGLKVCLDILSSLSKEEAPYVQTVLNSLIDQLHNLKHTYNVTEAEGCVFIFSGSSSVGRFTREDQSGLFGVCHLRSDEYEYHSDVAIREWCDEKGVCVLVFASCAVHIHAGELVVHHSRCALCPSSIMFRKDA